MPQCAHSCAALGFRRLFLLTLVTSAGALHAQTPALPVTLGFEAPPVAACPGGWSCNPPETIAADSEVVHGGKWSARIERKGDSAQQFSGLTNSVPVAFEGKTVELRGYIRTENASDFAAFWMREDGVSGAVAFASMQERQPAKGTTPWTEYSISLPVNSAARTLFFGFLMSGTGKAWADDLRLLVDGKPLEAAPRRESLITALDRDHEFDGGSRIVLNELSPVQIDNLTTLGKVWGFLKYHHPEVAAGKRHFDYDLLRVLPKILAAPDRNAANDALLRWAKDLGDVAACTKCAHLSDPNLYLRPDLAWISDERLLGSDLSRLLRAVYDNRPTASAQFYVSLTRIGNPVFEHEPVYSVDVPDPGFQILALFRYWNIVEYWYPYRELIGNRNWNAILPDFLPRIALAKDRDSYQREFMALIARVQDTHANLWSSLAVRPPVGACQLPVDVRFVENQAVIASYSNAELGKAKGLRSGDVIEQLDGASVADLIKEWMPYYAASNETTRLRDIARNMTRGDCSKPLTLRIKRGTDSTELTLARVAASRINPQTAAAHDRSGDTFQMLSPDVAYLKLSSVKAADAAGYVEAARKAKGLIIDIRNYPSEYLVFALGRLLVDRSAPFVRFTQDDLANPGATVWRNPVSLEPQKPHYAGEVVILIDETSQSQSEYTTMALRTAPGAVVIGSTTAGADGDVSPIPLPGELNTMISGLGVFYPDKKPTQRIGIVPNLEVKPTIAGIRDGRDEVLEAAIRQVLGPKTSDAVVRRMAAVH